MKWAFMTAIGHLYQTFMKVTKTSLSQGQRDMNRTYWDICASSQVFLGIYLRYGRVLPATTKCTYICILSFRG